MRPEGMLQLVERWALLMALALALSLGGAEARGDEEDIIQLAKAGVAQARARVQSGSGSVLVSRNVTDSEGSVASSEMKVTAWFHRGRIRLTVERNTGSFVSFEGVFDGAATTTWFMDPRFDPPVRVCDSFGGVLAGTFTAYVDPLGHGIAGFFEGSRLACVGREVLNGDECLLIEDQWPSCPEPGARFWLRRTWLNVAKGFAAPRVQQWAVQGGSRVLCREARCTLRDYGDGLWGPDVYTETDFGADGSMTKTVTVVYDAAFSMNQDIDESTFTLKLPRGIAAYDERSRALYTVP